MKTKLLFGLAALLAISAPAAALAAPVTLQCGVGQIRIMNRGPVGATKVSFRDNLYTEAGTLCDAKRNAYCSIDASDPGVIRLQWTMRDGTTANGQLRLQYDYALDLASNTVSTSLRDMYGIAAADEPASRCEIGAHRPPAEVAYNGPFQIDTN